MPPSQTSPSPSRRTSAVFPFIVGVILVSAVMVLLPSTASGWWANQPEPTILVQLPEQDGGEDEDDEDSDDGGVVVLPAGDPDQNRYGWSRTYDFDRAVGNEAALVSQEICVSQNLLDDGLTPMIDGPRRLPEINVVDDLDLELRSQPEPVRVSGHHPLSGTWTIEDGALIQWDDSAYDLMTRLAIFPSEDFEIGVTIKGDDDWLAGGVTIGQTIGSRRSGAVVIDWAEGGTFLRWGCYDDRTDQFRYLGGADMPIDFDVNTPHRLVVRVVDGVATVAVDGEPVGAFLTVSHGHLGLITSMGAAVFCDLTITDLTGSVVEVSS